MKLEDILALTKAGFTKEEILSLSQTSPSTTSASPEPEPAAVTTPAAAPAPEKAEEKKDDIGAIIEQKIGEAFKPFEDLYNNIAIKANMPTIGQIQPKGIDDIVNDFFTK